MTANPALADGVYSVYASQVVNGYTSANSPSLTVTITNGSSAIDLIGHYTDFAGGTPDYTRMNINDAPGYYGLNS